MQKKNLGCIVDEIAREGVSINLKILENSSGWFYALISIRSPICRANLARIINRLDNLGLEYKLSSGDHVAFIETIPYMQTLEELENQPNKLTKTTEYTTDKAHVTVELTRKEGQ